MERESNKKEQVIDAWKILGNVSDQSHAVKIKELTEQFALSEAKCQETEAIAVKKGEEAAQMIVSLKKEV